MKIFFLLLLFWQVFSQEFTPEQEQINAFIEKLEGYEAVYNKPNLETIITKSLPPRKNQQNPQQNQGKKEFKLLLSDFNSALKLIKDEKAIPPKAIEQFKTKLYYLMFLDYMDKDPENSRIKRGNFFESLKKSFLLDPKDKFNKFYWFKMKHYERKLPRVESIIKGHLGALETVQEKRKQLEESNDYLKEGIDLSLPELIEDMEKLGTSKLNYLSRDVPKENIEKAEDKLETLLIDDDKERQTKDLKEIYQLLGGRDNDQQSNSQQRSDQEGEPQDGQDEEEQPDENDGNQENQSQNNSGEENNEEEKERQRKLEDEVLLGRILKGSKKLEELELEERKKKNNQRIQPEDNK